MTVIETPVVIKAGIKLLDIFARIPWALGWLAARIFVFIVLVYRLVLIGWNDGMGDSD